jgi:hypothetical protein
MKLEVKTELKKKVFAHLSSFRVSALTNPELRTFDERS